MTIANLITLLRLVLVPVIIWALLVDQQLMAFILFLFAGLSDAVDGAVARYFDQQSEFGTILDPIADKVMLVSVFIVLAYLGHLPLWLTILVVSRDLLIVFGVMLAFVLSKPVTIKPLWVSKTNTAMQIILALWVLCCLAFSRNYPTIDISLVLITGLLTASSAVAYILQGLALFASDDTDSDGKNKTDYSIN